MNGANKSFKDFDFDQSIFEMKWLNERIACLGFLMLKYVPIVALFMSLSSTKVGIDLTFRESIKFITVSISSFSSVISFKASRITFSNAPF